MSEHSFNEERGQIVAAASYLAEAGVLSHSGHGNLSVRLPGSGDRMLLTSISRSSRLLGEHIAVVDFDGELKEGALDPTTLEIVAMHAVVYRDKPAVQAVIHTHSPCATSYAFAHQPLPCEYEALLRLGVADAVPVAPWGPRGSDESIRHIAETMQQQASVMAVLLANHGLLAFGRDILGAASLVTIMEEAAEMSLGAQRLGGAKPFPPGALAAVRERLRQFHG